MHCGICWSQDPSFWQTAVNDSRGTEPWRGNSENELPVNITPLPRPVLPSQGSSHGKPALGPVAQLPCFMFCCQQLCILYIALLQFLPHILCQKLLSAFFLWVVVGRISSQPLPPFILMKPCCPGSQCRLTSELTGVHLPLSPECCD